MITLSGHPNRSVCKRQYPHSLHQQNVCQPSSPLQIPRVSDWRNEALLQVQAPSEPLATLPASWSPCARPCPLPLPLPPSQPWSQGFDTCRPDFRWPFEARDPSEQAVTYSFHGERRNGPSQQTVNKSQEVNRKGTQEPDFSISSLPPPTRSAHPQLGSCLQTSPLMTRKLPLSPRWDPQR